MTEISHLEKELALRIGKRYAVALSSGAAALHLAVKLAAERAYGKTEAEKYSLNGKKVFVPNFADKTVADVVTYEGGEPVFIDASPDNWGIDPEVLEIAFESYPDVKIVIASHVYGFPCRIDEIKAICASKGALLIEDARESLGSKLAGKKTGSFGDYGVVDADMGGALLTDSDAEAEKAKAMSIGTHLKGINEMQEVGYNYVLSPIIVKTFLEQLEKLDGKIEGRREVYELYAEKFPEYMAELNPIEYDAEPNFAHIAMTVESDICFEEERFEDGYSYESVHGTAAPMQIIETLQSKGLKASLVYKPLSSMPEYASCEDITLDGKRSEYEFADNADFIVRADEADRIWKNGVCLPMEIGKIDEAADAVFECFDADTVSF
ncbi:MAG: DegT/DnrJ/EryC1/StrS family aminotransferase [Lachnospiraceae bacterium]|nr:DegT/DnrJ/EryC1/StrS family aminotransferase [Lachnospiraceae bacterium]